MTTNRSLRRWCKSASKKVSTIDKAQLIRTSAPTSSVLECVVPGVMLVAALIPVDAFANRAATTETSKDGTN